MSPSASPAEPLLARARGLLAAADAEGTPLRLIGGAGIFVLLGERLPPRFEREIADIDLITTRKASRAVERLLEHEGFTPEREFNALNGARRLLFHDPQTQKQLDVFVERFEMCHALPLSERIDARKQTLPAAELAMTKLQIVALNEKDRNDLYALLTTLEVGESDFEPPAADGEQARGADSINATRIATLAAEDWGLHHTFELNLERLDAEVQHADLPPELATLARQRTAALGEALERAPKSRAWKLRARIGERKRWYEEPEEVDR